jgi:hypothetical protein
MRHDGKAEIHHNALSLVEDRSKTRARSIIVHKKSLRKSGSCKRGDGIKAFFKVKNAASASRIQVKTEPFKRVVSGSVTAP